MNKDIEFNFSINENREQELWNDAIFVFDSSALLSLYEYSDKGREEIINKVIDPLTDRLFLVGHVEYEFLKNRKTKINNPIKERIRPVKDLNLSEMSRALKIIKNQFGEIKTKTTDNNFPPTFPNDFFNDFDQLLIDFDARFTEMKASTEARLNDEESKIKNLINDDDPVYKLVEEKFIAENNYSTADILKLITDEGEFRFRNKIPPGYEDDPQINSKSKSKRGIQIYADFIIWKQILDLGLKLNSNIIFVTNDLKEDWCYKDVKNKDRVDRPREELVKEFNDHTGMHLWVYSLSNMMFYTEKYTERKISEDVQKEVVESILDQNNYLREEFTIQCVRCDNQSTFTSDQIDMEFDIHSSSERNMGLEIHYKAEDVVFCPHCDLQIDFEFDLYEYPIGILNFEQHSFDGAKVIYMGDVTSKFWDEYKDRHSYEE